MFKIMMYAGEWSTLYVSSHADTKMQSFQPKSAHSVGVEKEYHVERLVWRSGYAVGGQAVMLLIADSALTTHCVRSALREQKSELETICNTDDETTSDVLWLSVENTCRIIDRIGPITARQTASPRLLRAASIVAAASFLLTASLFLTQDFAPWRTKDGNGSGGIALWSSATAKRLDDVARRVSRLDESVTTATKEIATIRNGRATESPVRLGGEKPVGITNAPVEPKKTAMSSDESPTTPVSRAKESIEALPVFDLPIDLNYIQAFHHDIRLRPSPAAKSLDVIFETPVIDMTNFHHVPHHVGERRRDPRRSGDDENGDAEPREKTRSTHRRNRSHRYHEGRRSFDADRHVDQREDQPIGLQPAVDHALRDADRAVGSKKRSSRLAATAAVLRR
jgi:hypothetical protein